MPCLELKVAALPHPEPATRLRALLEKPGAAILRRNYVAEVPGYYDPQLRNRVRVAAVLAVDLSDPPQPPGSAADTAAAASSPAASSSDLPADPLSANFAKGLEIWMTDSERAVRSFADADEIPSALALFDAWLRLARFQPAFERVDRRLVGLHYTFREGLSIGIQGTPAENPPDPESYFDGVAAIPEIDDFRDEPFVVRLPGDSLAFFHELLRSASTWLDENSYSNILGSK